MHTLSPDDLPARRLPTLTALVAHHAALAYESHERLIATGLDANHAITATVHKRGDRSHVPCRPAELLGPLLASRCVAVALVHNHPSGSAQPSAADRAFTARMQWACAIVGVRLIDHVIVASGGWFSFAQQGLLDAEVPWPVL